MGQRDGITAQTSSIFYHDNVLCCEKLPEQMKWMVRVVKRILKKITLENQSQLNIANVCEHAK